jgi:diguanylate cyclase (GGDEF)-like protein/PAS domain S-box-containing protein
VRARKPPSDDASRTLTRKDDEDGTQPWQERFRGAFETAGHGMAIVGLDGRFIDVNKVLAAIVGYTQAELCQLDFQAITHPGDLESDLDHVRRMLSGDGGAYEMEKRYIHKDGQTIWAQLNVGLIRGPDERPLYFVSQIRDITERKHMEETRQQTEAALARAQKLAHLGYYRWSRSKQQLISHNEEYLHILGLTPDAVSGDLIGVEPYLHPDDRERVIAVHRSAEREGSGYHLEFRILRADGTVRHLLDLNEPDPGSGDAPETWSGTIQDITLQKQQAEILKTYQARLELALETASAAYWELDLLDQRYSSGPEYFAILGYGAEEATEDKDSWLAQIHPDDRTRVEQSHLLPPDDKANHELEYRIRGKDGRWHWFLSHFRACAFDEFGRPIRLLGIDIDITEQRRREAELSEARSQVANAAQRAKIAFWRQEFGFGEMIWSEGAAQVIGRPTAELPATTEEYLKFIHRDDADRLRTAYVRARAQGKPYDLEYRILRSDGTLAWFHEIGQIGPVRGGGSVAFSGTLQDITERKKLEARLEQLATVDELTGAQNRRSIQTLAQVELRRSRRSRHALSFLFLDIDHFKQINDRFGHKIGDLVLSTLSDVCRGALRPSDIFARYGGEEFLVMLPETDIVQATTVAQRLLTQVRKTVFTLDPAVQGLTVSAGISAIRDADDTLEFLLERVDRALYRAKERGRDRIEIEA